MAATSLLGACMESDWDTPDMTNPPYGNNTIVQDPSQQTTIGELIANYSAVISSSSYAQITGNLQLMATVTGNDIGGNLYKQITIQDATGAMIVGINTTGLFPYLSVGQQILIDLNGLCIGGYGQQAQLGDEYNGSIGRMSADKWEQHVRILPTHDMSQVDTLDFDVNMDKDANCAKLVTLHNVSFVPVGGLGTFAPDTAQDKTVTLIGGCVNRALNEYSESQLVVRTSTYAKFAAMKLPYDEVNKRPLKCNITGIATRYNNTWQILIRKESDIEVLE